MDIRVKYLNEMSELNNDILKMAIIVRKALDSAIEALIRRDKKLAKEVIDSDSDIDKMELDLCDRCAILIATEQPVAHDLRVILGVLKIVTDLERMADLACHVAKGALKLSDNEYGGIIDLISNMASIAGKMTEDSIFAFIRQDSNMAEMIAKRDDEIDDFHHRVTKKLLNTMMDKTGSIEEGSILMFLSRSIERYADHVENICEWVVYTSTGIHKEL